MRYLQVSRARPCATRLLPYAPASYTITRALLEAHSDMWWIFFCALDCDVAGVRNAGWRAETPEARLWQDASHGIMNTLYQGAEAPEYSVGYSNRRICMRALRDVHREGEYSFDHWSWRPPTVRMNVIHHPDYVEVQFARAPVDAAEGGRHYWGCLQHEGPNS